MLRYRRLHLLPSRSLPLKGLCTSSTCDSVPHSPNVWTTRAVAVEDGTNTALQWLSRNKVPYASAQRLFRKRQVKVVTPNQKPRRIKAGEAEET